jgi:uncharacterized protein (DUF2141 family)
MAERDLGRSRAGVARRRGSGGQPGGWRAFVARRLALAAVLSLATAGLARAALVEVAVTGVSEARGHVRVELCTRETFLGPDCPYSGQAPATVGSTMVTIAQVQPGRYAAQAFQDDTDQGVIHRNLLGVPREPIGFSNNAPLHVRGPRFTDAAFSVGAEMERVTLRLRRLFGRGN